MGLRIAILVVALLFSASTASAQDVAADALLEQGLALRERGEHARALVYFQRAYEIDPSPRAIAQIALANQALHQWLVAYRKLTEALTHTDDSWIRTRRQALETALNSARAHVGFVGIEGGIPGSHIFVNGEDAGVAPLQQAVVVEPGLVRVEMRVSEEVVLSRELPVEAADTAEVSLPAEIATPDPVATAETANAPHESHESPERVPPRGTTLKIVGWTTAAIGVAGIALGTGFQLMRERSVSSANSCADEIAARTGCSPAEWATRSANIDSDRTISTVAYIASGVLVVAGVALVIVAGNRNDSLSEAALACGPAFGAVGASCAGRF